MILECEVSGHSALALDTAAKGNTDEIPVQIVGPLVVDTFEVRRVAAALTANHGAAMRAPVEHDMQAAILVARDDDGRVADERRLVVARFRHLGFQGDEIPGGAAKETLLLRLVIRLVSEDRVGNPAPDAIVLARCCRCVGRAVIVEHVLPQS